MQQINLYTEEFRPRQDPLALVNMLAVAGTLLVLFLVYSVWLWWGNYQQEQLLADLTAGNTVLQTEVDDLAARLEARAKDTRLENENQVLKIRLRNTEQLLAAIGEGAGQEPEEGRFGDALTALAKHRLEAVWMTQIRILDGGGRLQLTGRTRAPDQVPRYLQAIGSESVFSGRSFNVFVIDEQEQGSADIRAFEVDTITPDQAGARSDAMATRSAREGNAQ